jgi:hypothetical protein
MLCLTTPLVFFHSDRGRPQGMVDLRGGLGYRVLICRPVQRGAVRLDVEGVAGSSRFVFQFPLVECCPSCVVLLEGGREDAIHAVRQICDVPTAHLGSKRAGHPVPFQRVIFRGPAHSDETVM